MKENEENDGGAGVPKDADSGMNLTGRREVLRRDFLRMAGASAGAFALAPWLGGKRAEAAEAGAPGKRPNIVFIFDDQYRADMPKFIDTPAARRLGQEGTTFANSISICPLCTPYRGMLMTGRYATHSGIVLNFVNASPVQNPDCLANAFDRAGYDTAFIGKWHLSAGRRVGDGLYKENLPAEREYKKSHPHYRFTPPGPDRLGFKFWQAFNFDSHYNDYSYYEDTPKPIHSDRYETDTMFDQAIAYIEQQKNGEKPFLMVVAPHPPHPPWNLDSVPKGYLDKIPPAGELYRSPNVPKTGDPTNLEQLRMYLAMVKNVDDNLGRLMDYLDKSGVGDNTILIFTADHGEMAGSHGRLNKMVPYAEAVNVPLKIRWPGKIPAGVVSDALFTPIDHLTTLCGLAGISSPSMADGEDLSQVVLGKARSNRESVLMANYTSHWDFFQTETKWPEWRGVHTKRYTYAKWLRGDEMLFDNLSDPYQMHNLVGEEGAKDTLLEMRSRLKQHMIAAHDDFLNGRQYASWYDSKRNLVKTALGPVRRGC